VSREVKSPPERFEAGPERQVFVEGETDLSFDVVVLNELLGSEGVRVRPAGGCDNVIAAAHAFAKAGAGPGFVGANCYAIVDRDHRADDEVEQMWAGGPFADGRIHLYWRRHEFENYFLEPEFVAQSAYLREDRTVAGVRRAVREVAQRHVFVDAANLVLKAVREECKRWDVPEFGVGEADFSTAASARKAFLTGRDYGQIGADRVAVLFPPSLGERFDANVALLLGEADGGRLEFGRGQWLEMMEGSKLIGSVLSERFFRVRGSDGKDLRGLDLQLRVARDLMRRFDDLAYRPADSVAVRDYFRDTQPKRFPATDTAGSPPSR
jgi:hypothetical protein